MTAGQMTAGQMTAGQMTKDKGQTTIDSQLTKIKSIGIWVKSKPDSFQKST